MYVPIGGSHGCDLLRLVRVGDRFKIDPVYSNKNMSNHHGNVVLVDDHIYGAGGGKGWVCQSFEFGEIDWEVTGAPARDITSAPATLDCSPAAAPLLHAPCTLCIATETALVSTRDSGGPIAINHR